MYKRQQEPGPHASRAKSTTTAHPVGQPHETEGAHDQAGNDLGTRGEGSAHPRRPSKLLVIERAIQSLQYVPRLFDMQGADPRLGKVRRVLDSRGGTRVQEGFTDAEVSTYLKDDQNLPWHENVSTRGPAMPSTGPARVWTLPTWPPSGGLDVVAVARHIPLARNV